MFSNVCTSTIRGATWSGIALGGSLLCDRGCDDVCGELRVDYSNNMPVWRIVIGALLSMFPSQIRRVDWKSRSYLVVSGQLR